MNVNFILFNQQINKCEGLKSSGSDLLFICSNGSVALELSLVFCIYNAGTTTQYTELVELEKDKLQESNILCILSKHKNWLKCIKLKFDSIEDALSARNYIETKLGKRERIIGSRFLFIINPYGGSKTALSLFKSITQPLLYLTDTSYEHIVTKSSGFIEDYFKSNPTKKFNCLILAGGDGLLNQTIVNNLIEFTY